MALLAIALIKHVREGIQSHKEYQQDEAVAPNRAGSDVAGVQGRSRTQGGSGPVFNLIMKAERAMSQLPDLRGSNRAPNTGGDPRRAAPNGVSPFLDPPASTRDRPLQADDEEFEPSSEWSAPPALDYPPSYETTMGGKGARDDPPRQNQEVYADYTPTYPIAPTSTSSSSRVAGGFAPPPLDPGLADVYRGTRADPPRQNQDLYANYATTYYTAPVSPSSSTRVASRFAPPPLDSGRTHVYRGSASSGDFGIGSIREGRALRRQAKEEHKLDRAVAKYDRKMNRLGRA